MSTRGLIGGALAALVVLGAALPLQAHGPTRQKVTEKVEINAPAEKVWAVIGTFHDMGWHPAVAKTEGSGGNVVGAVRILNINPVGQIVEALTKYDVVGRSMSYEITAVDMKVLPVNNYAATLTVEALGGKSVVEWKSAFYRGFLNNDPPPELSDAAALAAVKGVFRSGLDALKAKVEAGG